MAWYLPGQTYQENFLPHRQADLGHDVAILASDGAPPKFQERYPDGFDPGRHQEDGVAVHRLEAGLTLQRRSQTTLKGLGSALNAFDPDVVHAHGLRSLPTLQLLLPGGLGGPRAPLFVDEHADNGNLQLEDLDRRILFGVHRRLVLPILTRRAEAVLPVNPFAKTLVTERLGLDDDDVTPLWLGLAEDRFAPDPQAGAAAREDLGLDPEDTVFATATALEPSKEIDTLLRAHDEVLAENQGTHLLVIGDGPDGYVAELRDLAADLGIEDDVTWTGWLSDDQLPSAIQAADVAVMPGKLSATREAVAAGKPLVVPDELAPRYLISNDNGLMHERGNPSDLARAMLEYASDPDVRRRHGTRSRELVEERLGWTQIAERSVEIYRSRSDLPP